MGEISLCEVDLVTTDPNLLSCCYCHMLHSLHVAHCMGHYIISSDALPGPEITQLDWRDSKDSFRSKILGSVQPLRD
ncbi:hypothetical protein R3I93_022478 [Phoxinus phoxinus]|uniref:Uncharacterized protein n=1 Tax=Phoxinus phoxinus TaxID=58324 RepID=A0AAN9C406_9TELE